MYLERNQNIPLGDSAKMVKVERELENPNPRL